MDECEYQYQLYPPFRNSSSSSYESQQPSHKCVVWGIIVMSCKRGELNLAGRKGRFYDRIFTSNSRARRLVPSPKRTRKKRQKTMVRFCSRMTRIEESVVRL